MDDFIKAYGMSKARVNRILKIMGVSKESSRNGHGSSRNGTAHSLKANGRASTRSAKKPSRARKLTSGKKSR
jgi:hypothetical protein